MKMDGNFIDDSYDHYFYRYIPPLFIQYVRCICAICLIKSNYMNFHIVFVVLVVVIYIIKHILMSHGSKPINGNTHRSRIAFNINLSDCAGSTEREEHGMSIY